MEEKKLYILDTSVLLYKAAALYAFPGAGVGIPLVVLEELDHMKEEHSFRGSNAREVIRILDTLREHGHLFEGIELDNGSTLQILVSDEMMKRGTGVQAEEIDDLIIACARKLKDSRAIVLVTRDINMRVKADVFGVQAISFATDMVSEQTIYKGYTILSVPSVQLKKDIPDDMISRHREQPFVLNEFIIVQSNNNPFNARLFRYVGNNQFKCIEAPELKWSIQPRNIQQRMALDLLFDNSIQLVTLIGPAGTGKTFLALIAALHEVLFFETYERILVTRPIIPLGKDIGFLPGDVGEKLHSWMQPIYDNMDFLIHSATAAQRAMGIYREDEFEAHGHNGQRDNGHKGEKSGKHKKNKGPRSGLMPLEELIRLGKIGLEAITYMRGRSIPYQFIIIDESQNLTAHEIKTLISRVGEGSKIVLAGDPYQIDLPTLDFSTNGLTIASERFKGQSLFGTVFLETTERSELSRLAATLL